MNLETAVVESAPDSRGRVKVRVLGYHNMDKTKLATEDLPWAQCVYPVTQHVGVGGAGANATCLQPGAWVTGYYRDGSNAQDFVVLGTLAGGNGAGGEAFGPGQYGLSSSTSGYFNGGSGGAMLDPHTGLPVAPLSPVTGSGKGVTLANMARSKRGSIREDGGANNRGTGIKELWAATSHGTSGYGLAYCAAFVCSMIAQSGVLPDNRRPRSALAYDMLGWAKGNQDLAALRMRPREIFVGDIIVYNWSHVGIAVEGSNGKNGFVTVEGNTHSEQVLGQGVWDKHRRLSNVKAAITLV